jgi:hypothetical protein
MSELGERLREAAEAAAREGRIPDATAVVTRGRRRRVRLAGATALLVVVAVVVGGAVGADRLTRRPAPLAPPSTAGPTTRTGATTSTVPPQPWIPTVTPLKVKARPGPYPGPDPGRIVQDVTSLVRGCHGKSRVRLWARAQGKVWLVAAKPTPPGQQRVCWASALMNQGKGGGGALGTMSSQLKPLRATFASGGGNGQLGVVSGTVTRRAARLRILFHRGQPLEVMPVEGGDGVPVNFYAGFYLESGPPPAEGQQRVGPIDRVVAYDAAGNQVAECRMRFGPSNTC